MKHGRRSLRFADWAGAETGLEQAEIRMHADGIDIAAVVIGTIEGAPFGLSYALGCDAAWRLVTARIADLDGRDIALAGAGGLWTLNGASAPHLDGCIDIDIRATPLTNTLPIRRLGLAAGQSAEIGVVYVDVPSLTVSASRQRYTCLREGLFRFDSLDSDFTAELPVDGDGFVTDYPGLFRRL